jgi:hypothetical protein
VKGRRLLIALVFCLMGCASLDARPAKTHTLPAEQAKDHVGETATVCGQVASVHYAYKTGGHPTFLNLDAPYPRQIFTVVIWGRDRPKFGAPEKRYLNKHICAKGSIRVFRGQPEIIAQSPKQIKEQ